MLLSIDIGNTNITLGVFDNENLIETFRLASDKDLSQNEYEVLLKTLCKDYKICDCVIGSVVEELTSVLKKASEKVFNLEVLLVNSEINCGLKIALKNPKAVGADRIANAYSAKTKFSLPVIVVDIGTATTFDIVSKKEEFLGGIIMPGLNS